MGLIITINMPGKRKHGAENHVPDESKPSKSRKISTQIDDRMEGNDNISTTFSETCPTKEKHDQESLSNEIISTRTALDYFEAIQYRALINGNTKLLNVANKGNDLVSDLRMKSLAKEHGISKDPSSDVPLSFLLLQHLMGGEDWDWDEYVNCDRDVPTCEDPENPASDSDDDDDEQDDDSEDDEPPNPIITTKTALLYLEQIKTLALNMNNHKLSSIVSDGIKIVKQSSYNSCMKQTKLEDFFSKYNAV